VIFFFGSTFGFGSSNLPSLDCIFGTSNRLVIGNACDGLTKTICGCFKGISSSVELGNFGLFGFSSREKGSTSMHQLLLLKIPLLDYQQKRGGKCGYQEGLQIIVRFFGLNIWWLV
jgi:hypothetical protein